MTAFALMTRGSLILTSQRYKFWVIIPSVDKPDDLLTNLIMPDGCYIALVVIRNLCEKIGLFPALTFVIDHNQSNN